MHHHFQTDRMHLLQTLDRYFLTGFLGEQPVGQRIVSCRPLCIALWDDGGLFEANFASWIKSICGPEEQIWWRLGGTWGAAARAAAYFIDHSVMGQHGRPVRPQGIWVAKALRMTRPSARWSVEIPRRSSVDAE